MELMRVLVLTISIFTGSQSLLRLDCCRYKFHRFELILKNAFVSLKVVWSNIDSHV